MHVEMFEVVAIILKYQGSDQVRNLSSGLRKRTSQSEGARALTVSLSYMQLATPAQLQS